MLLVACLLAVAKYSIKAAYGRKGWLSVPFHTTRSIVVGKAWWQEREAAGHIVFAVRKQGVVGVAAQLSFILTLSQMMKLCCPHLGQVFLPQLT